MIFRAWDLRDVSLQTQNQPLTGTGRVSITNDSRVMINAEIRGNVSLPTEPILVTGTTTDGFNLTAEESWATNRTTTFAKSAITKLEIKPTRCKLVAPSVNQNWDEQIFTLKNAQFSGSDQFVVDGDPCQLSFIERSTQNILAGELTSQLTIKPLTPTNRDLSPTAYDICMLITLAQRCPVFCGVIEMKSGGKTSEIHLNDLNQDYKPIFPMIDSKSSEICAFIQSTWPQFKKQEENYNLRVLIDYYWRAYQESYAEIKMIFACIFMESLKFNWAQNVSTVLDLDRKPNGLIRGFHLTSTQGQKNRPHVNFKDLLTMASKDIGYSPDNDPDPFTFFDDRNAIFHSGLSTSAQLGHNSSWPHLKPVIQKIYAQMDELILRILEFKGQIHLHNGTSQQFP